MSTVEQDVQTIVAELVRRPLSELGPEARLEGSGIDSLTMIDLTVSLEEKFGIAFAPDGTPADLAISTMSDLVRLVERLIGEQDVGRP